MGNVTLPHALTDGTTAYGSQVRANDDAIVAVVNGNIDNANVASGAAIAGSKLATASIPGDRLQNDAVTAVQLRDDAAVDANRAVTTDHIRDQAVTKGKVKLADLTRAQLAATTVNTAIPNATYNAHTMATLSLNLGIPATATIISVVKRGPNNIDVGGVPHGGLMPVVQLETTNNRWQLALMNTTLANIVIAGGYSVDVVYLPAS